MGFPRTEVKANIHNKNGFAATSLYYAGKVFTTTPHSTKIKKYKNIASRQKNNRARLRRSPAYNNNNNHTNVICVVIIIIIFIIIITATSGGMAIRYTSSGFVCVDLMRS